MRILIITEGPEEFPFMEPVLRRTLYTLKYYGPDAGGVTGHDLLVQEATAGSDDGGDGDPETATTQAFRTRLYLSGVYADTPANRKLSLHLAHTALQACPHCWQLGRSFPPVCFPGYLEPALTGCPNELRVAYPQLFGNVPHAARTGTPEIKVTGESLLLHVPICLTYAPLHQRRCPH